MVGLKTRERKREREADRQTDRDRKIQTTAQGKNQEITVDCDN